ANNQVHDADQTHQSEQQRRAFENVEAQGNAVKRQHALWKNKSDQVAREHSEDSDVPGYRSVEQFASFEELRRQARVGEASLEIPLHCDDHCENDYSVGKDDEE